MALTVAQHRAHTLGLLCSLIDVTLIGQHFSLNAKSWLLFRWATQNKNVSGILITE